MIQSHCVIYNPLLRDGTNQLQRLPAELRPEYIRLDERSVEDLMLYAKNYARSIRFFNAENQTDGTWSDFFNFSDAADFISQAETKPHLALFYAFLNVFKYAQENLNTLTERHLDFYFKEILQLKEKEATPDKLHVLFTLAKNVEQYRIEKESLFKAGKDDSGADRQYLSDRELVINKASVSGVKSLFRSDDKIFNRLYVQEAPDDFSVAGSSKALFKTFGESQYRKATPTMTPARVGFAIASTQFAMEEGTRMIELKLFAQNDFYQHLAAVESDLQTYYTAQLELDSIFKIEITTREGWATVGTTTWERMTDDMGYAMGFRVVLNFDSGFPAIGGLNPDVHQENLQTKYPVLRFTLRNDVTHNGYRLFKEFKIRKLGIFVMASGVKNLVLQHENARYPADAPFMPFGSQPTNGSRFYIGSPEIFSKNLVSLKLNWQWHGVPNSNLGTYYEGYEKGLSNFDWMAKVDWLESGTWKSWGANPIFDIQDAQLPSIMDFGSALPPEGQMNILWENYVPKAPESTATDGYSSDKKNGYLRFSLKGPTKAQLETFGQREYPVLQTGLIMNNVNANVNASAGNTVNFVPLNVPYIPQISKISIDYTASEWLEFNGSSLNLSSSAALFALENWGNEPLSTVSQSYMLPHFEEEGVLYFGLKDANPKDLVTLLFAFGDGSGNYTQDISKTKLSWSYLGQNGWLPLPVGNIAFDDTQGFIKSGIVGLLVPSGCALSNSLMPQGLSWFKITADKNAAGFDALSGLYAQTVEATVGRKADGSLPLPLSIPEQTLEGLTPKVSAIKTVTQEYASFGGHATESQMHFYTRVSERLRHKNRAINIWDFERLVLEEFPEIWKVKCINHANAVSEFAPGGVSLVVVPYLRNRFANNVLRPSVSSLKLEQIRRYLCKHTSPFAHVLVENPIYEEIMLDFKVGFYAGFDPNFYTLQLNEDLKRFLSPWAYLEGYDIVFGGEVYASRILAYIENLEYVDYIVDFKVIHNTTGSPFAGIGFMEIECNFIVSSLYEDIVSASGARAVLISAAQHHITALAPGEYTCPKNQIEIFKAGG